MPESLSTKVVKSGLWVFTLRILNRGLGFIRTIILARLLAPEDFGLLGIAMLSISTLETFSQTGFQAALIQKKENVESYLDTAWTVSAIRGGILFVLLFFSAPFIARFFNSPQATLIIRVIAVTVVLSGLKNIGVIFFEKELEFNKQFFYELSGTLTNFGVAIVLAFVLQNVWALIWGGLASRFVQFFMSYIVHPYRPRLKFDKNKFEELFGFGKWLLGQSIVIFLITQGDDIFLGKMLGVAALGLYQIAYLISNIPATEITHMISRVTFPAYSRMQDDLERMKQACLRVLRLTSAISIPLAASIFILAPELTQAVLTEKWMPMVPAMQVMCIFGAMRAIAATFGPVYRAIARPDIPLKINITSLLCLALLIYPLTMEWNILGTAIAVLLSMSLSLCLTSIQVTIILKIPIFNLYRTILFYTFASIFMLIVVLIIKLYLVTNTDMLSLIILIATSVICYLGFIFISKLFKGESPLDAMKILYASHKSR